MRRSLSLTIFALLLVVVAYGAMNQTSPQRRGRDEAQIRDILDATAVGWNRGDLQQYLAAYTETATEMGPNGPEGGKSAIERTMRQGFWKSGRPLQNLRYENV
jgi:hypothetical protein